MKRGLFSLWSIWFVVFFSLSGLSGQGFAEGPPVVQLSFRVEPADYYSSLLGLKKDIRSRLERQGLIVINDKNEEKVFDVNLEIDITGTAIGAEYGLGSLGAPPGRILYTGAEVQGTIKGVTRSKTVEEAFSGTEDNPGKTSATSYYKSQAPFYEAIEASDFWKKFADVVREIIDR